MTDKSTAVLLRKWPEPLTISDQFVSGFLSGDNRYLALHIEKERRLSLFDLSSSTLVKIPNQTEVINVLWFHKNARPYLVAVLVTGIRVLEFGAAGQITNSFMLPYSQFAELCKVSEVSPHNILGFLRSSEMVLHYKNQLFLIDSSAENLKLIRSIELTKVEERIERIWLKQCKWVLFILSNDIILRDITTSLAVQIPLVLLFPPSAESGDSVPDIEDIIFDIASDGSILSTLNISTGEVSIFDVQEFVSYNSKNYGISTQVAKSNKSDEKLLLSQPLPPWISRADSAVKLRHSPLVNPTAALIGCNSWSQQSVPSGLFRTEKENSDPSSGHHVSSPVAVPERWEHGYSSSSSPEAFYPLGSDTVYKPRSMQVASRAPSISVGRRYSLHKFFRVNEGQEQSQVTCFVGPVYLVIQIFPVGSRGSVYSQTAKQKPVCILVHLKSLEIFHYRYTEPTVLLLCDGIALPYFVTSSGLGVITVGFDRDTLVNRLIIFHGTPTAEKLYAVNGWNTTSLRLHALQMGLHFRQFDVLEEALSTFQFDEHLPAAQLLVTHLREMKPTIQDQSFVEQLLHSSLRFLSNSLFARVAPNLNDSNITRDNSSELQQLSCLLTILQHYVVKVNDVFSNTSQRTTSDADQNSSQKSISETKILEEESQSSIELYNTYLSRENSEISKQLTSINKTSTVDELFTSAIQNQLMEHKLLKKKNAEGQNVENSEFSLERILSSGLELEDTVILEDALTSGCLSLAISFLHWQTIFVSKKNPNTVNPVGFNYLHKLSYRIVHDAVVQLDLEKADVMIKHMGEDVIKHFYEILWYTSSKKIRQKLSKFFATLKIEHPNKYHSIIKDEREFGETLEFLKLVENYHSDQRTPVSNSLSPIVSVLYQNNTYTIGNHQLPISNIMSLVNRLFGEDKLAVIGKPFHDKFIRDQSWNLLDDISSEDKRSRDGGHGYFRLYWLNMWSDEQRQRVLLEALTSMDAPLSEWYQIPTKIATPTVGPFPQPNLELKYLLSHMDLRLFTFLNDNILRDLNQFLQISSDGSLHPRSDSQTSGSSHTLSVNLLRELCAGLESCPPFLASIIRNYLANFGLFVNLIDFDNEHKSPDAHNALQIFSNNNQNFLTILNSLAINGNLFTLKSGIPTISDANEITCLNMDAIIQSGKLTMFHEWFINKNAQSELYHLLYFYLESFNLAPFRSDLTDPRDSSSWLNIISALVPNLGNVELKENFSGSSLNIFRILNMLQVLFQDEKDGISAEKHRGKNSISTKKRIVNIIMLLLFVSRSPIAAFSTPRSASNLATISTTTSTKSSEVISPKEESQLMYLLMLVNALLAIPRRNLTEKVREKESKDSSKNLSLDSILDSLTVVLPGKDKDSNEKSREISQSPSQGNLPTSPSLSVIGSLYLGIALLACSPVNIRDMIASPEPQDSMKTLWNFFRASQSSIQRLVAPFPLLYSTIFSPQQSPAQSLVPAQSQPIIILSDIIKEHLPLFSKQSDWYSENLFPRHDESENVDGSSRSDKFLPLRSSHAHLAQSSYFNDIDISYYLTNGQPFHAFDLLFRNSVQKYIEKNSEVMVVSTVSLASPPSLVDIISKYGNTNVVEHDARTSCFNSILDDTTLAASSCFLELCHIDSASLRVDVTTARFLYQSYPNGIPNADSENDPSTDSNLVYLSKLFMSLSPDPRKTVPSPPSIVSSAQLVIQLLQDLPTTINPGGSEPAWNLMLLAMFTNIYNQENSQIPVDRQLLEYFAKQNDWASFLEEAQKLRCSLDTLLQIAANDISQQSLKDHVKICFQILQSSQHIKQQLISSNFRHIEDGTRRLFLEGTSEGTDVYTKTESDSTDVEYRRANGIFPFKEFFQNHCGSDIFRLIESAEIVCKQQRMTPTSISSTQDHFVILPAAMEGNLSLSFSSTPGSTTTTVALSSSKNRNDDTTIGVTSSLFSSLTSSPSDNSEQSYWNSPGEFLYCCAFALSRPLLALVSLCFDTEKCMDPVHGLLAWLISSTPHPTLSFILSEREKINPDFSTPSSEAPMLSATTVALIQMAIPCDDKNKRSPALDYQFVLQTCDEAVQDLAIIIYNCCEFQFQQQYIASINAPSVSVHSSGSTFGFLENFIKGFELFAPSHILIMWFKFYNAFLQFRLEDAQNYLSMFIQNLRNPEFPVLLRKIGDVPWVESVAINMADLFLSRPSNLYKSGLITAPFIITNFNYEIGRFLELLGQVMFTIRHTELHHTFSLLQKADLLPLVISQNSNSLKQSGPLGCGDWSKLPTSIEVVDLLLKNGRFESALEFTQLHSSKISSASEIIPSSPNINLSDYAQNNKLPHYITMLISFHHVKAQAKKRQEAMKWVMGMIPNSPAGGNGNEAENAIFSLGGEQQRFFHIEQLWEDIQNLFLAQGIYPPWVGEFLLVEADVRLMSQKNNPNGKSAVSTVKEIVLLLSMAYDWLSGKFNQVVGHFPPRKEREQTKLAWKKPSYLSKLQAQILETSVQAEIHSLSHPQSIPSKNTTLYKGKARDDTIKRKLAFESGESSMEKDSLHTETPSPTKQTATHTSTMLIDVVVGRLLNEGNIEEARKVCAQFSHTSLELDLICAMVALASGQLAVEFLDEKIKSRISELITIDFNSVSKEELLEALVSLCRTAKTFANQVLIKFKISQLLSVAFEQIDEQDPYTILSYLLREGHAKLSLTRYFIQFHPLLEQSRIALLISHYFLHAILGLSYASSPGMKRSRRRDLDSAMFFSVGTSYGGPLNSMPNSVPTLSGLASPDSKFNLNIEGKSTRIFPQEIPQSPSNMESTGAKGTSLSQREFLDLVCLVQDPSLIGYTFVDYLVAYYQPNTPTSLVPSSNKGTTAINTATSSPRLDADKSVTSPGNLPKFTSTTSSAYISDAISAEILIHAHLCFLAATNLVGIEKVMDIISNYASGYVHRQQFKLFVRLLTGTKQYTRLQYLMEILVQYDCFEYLLGKHVVVDNDDKRELQVAIFNFLKAKYPQDDHKLKLVFLRFGMFREYADMLYAKATYRLSQISFKQQTHISVSTLLDVMYKLLDAAENYQKSEALRRAEECHHMAELVSLQVENPETQFVNLERNQVVQLITFVSSFDQAYILAKAYRLNDLTDWIAPVYHQVIENGNFEFLSSLSGIVPLPNPFFLEIVRKWKSATLKKKAHLANLRTFLLFLDDHSLRTEILNSIGGVTTKS